MFLRKLREEGHKILYCPGAVVGHKVGTEQLTSEYLIKRAYSWGRGMAHIRPLCREELFERKPVLWRFIRVGAIMRDSFNMAKALVPLALNNPVNAMYAMQWMGYNVELMNIAKGFNKR
jgi:hypothetical protein